MSHLRVVVLAACVLAIGSGGCGKRTPAALSDVGEVVSSGKTEAADDHSVMVAHRPPPDARAVFDRYAAALEGRGWKRSNERHETSWCERVPSKRKDKDAECHGAEFERAGKQIIVSVTHEGGSPRPNEINAEVFEPTR